MVLQLRCECGASADGWAGGLNVGGRAGGRGVGGNNASMLYVWKTGDTLTSS